MRHAFALLTTAVHVLGASAIAAGCAPVRSPAVTPQQVSWNAPRMPPSCEVRVENWGCTLGSDPSGEAHFAIKCQEPVPQPWIVANIRTCGLPEATAERIPEPLRTATCEAGGDTLVYLFGVTDGRSCPGEIHYQAVRMRVIPRGSDSR